MSADPDLIALFVRGWAITRQVSPPVPCLGGHYIEVCQPDQRARYVFPSLDRNVIADLARAITEPFVYLKICDSEDAVRAILPRHWAIRRPPTYMMTTSLVPGESVLPAGYALAIAQDGPILSATISADTVAVACGRIALLGDTILFDQVATDEAHRRRGLGRALMQALSNAGMERGAANGLLSATEMGRDLYETIGWIVHAPYVSAVIPG
jgi:GNAT superfamily N-acetyltransferase